VEHALQSGDQPHSSCPWVNPAIVSCNASVVKTHNTTNSLKCFADKIILFSVIVEIVGLAPDFQENHLLTWATFIWSFFVLIGIKDVNVDA
jgi:hypothetical protein